MATKKILLMMTALVVIGSLVYTLRGTAKTAATVCTLPCNKAGKAIIPAAVANDIIDCTDIYNNGMNLVFNCTLY